MRIVSVFMEEDELRTYALCARDGVLKLRTFMWPDDETWLTPQKHRHVAPIDAGVEVLGAKTKHSLYERRVVGFA